MSYKRKTFDMFYMFHSAILMTLAFAGLFSSTGWFSELCSHFYLQYFVVLLVLLVILALRRRWKLCLIVAPFVLICLYKLLPLYFPRPHIAYDHSQRLAVMTINVNTANRNIAAVAERIREYQPDVICFEEVDNWWVKELKSSLSKDYPFAIADPHDDNFGIAQLSKLPMQSSEILQLGDPPVPAVWCQYALNGRPISVVSIHTLPPGSPLHLHVRNGEFAAVAKLREKFGDCFVIAGDLNCTPYSLDFDKFVHDTGTYNSMQGFGVQCSWPTVPPFYPIFLIPIDHVLATPNLVCTKRVIGMPMGSDHFPVYAELFHADTTLRK